MAEKRGGGTPTEAAGKVRINVTLSQKNYTDLKRAAEAADMDMSEFVKNSLRVYFYLQQELSAEKRLYIGKDGDVEKEVLMP